MKSDIITLKPDTYLLERATNRMFRIFEVLQDDCHTCLVEPINSNSLKTTVFSIDADLIAYHKTRYTIINVFDMRYLNTFDLVLVRNYDSEDWQISYFGYLEYVKPPKRRYAVCSNGYRFLQCMPFNTHTKHFLGTNLTPKNFYKQMVYDDPEEE